MARLVLKDLSSYPKYSTSDPLRFYYYPIVGKLYRQRVEACLDQLGGGDRILEVGFGSGLCLHNLCEMYEEVHGVDLDAPVEAVSKFATANGLAVQLANGNVTDLIYPDEYFEAVLLISILEHLRSDELEQAMKEIKRVLKPGGQIVFGVPIESRFMSLAFRILGYDIKKLHFSSHIDVNYAAAKHFHQEKSFFLKHPLFPGAPIYQIGSFRKAIDQKTRRTSADA